MYKHIFTLCTVLSMLAGCQVSEGNQAQISIVTTIAPLYSLTAHIIEGTDIQLNNLLPANTSVHSFSMTPESARIIAESDAVIINGLQLETFLEKNLEGKYIIDTSESVQVMLGEEGGDPHIWLSPENAKIQSHNILKGLQKIDPNESVVLEKNYNNLLKKLDAVNDDAKARIQKIDLKPYITFHDAYHYFEKNFGIHAEAYLEEFPGKEPTPTDLAQIIDLITEKNISVIFSEPQFSPQLVNTLSNDYGIKQAVLNPMGSEISYNGYFVMIEENIAQFESVFAK